jgi:putative exosortase-associated protein (TIGR04073 family)
MARELAASVALIILVAFATPVAAYTAVDKLGRGFAAITTGFLEVPGNMVAESHARGPAAGIPLGFVKGLGMIVVRELVGVYEILSSPFPAPAGYRPIIKPEYPWEYFDGATRSELG